MVQLRTQEYNTGEIEIRRSKGETEIDNSSSRPIGDLRETILRRIKIGRPQGETNGISVRQREVIARISTEADLRKQ